MSIRIGLIRHFPVNHGFPSGWKTAAEMYAWQDEYDLAESPAGKFDLAGIQWQSCISSDLPRAVTTAKTVFQGEVEYTPILREVRFNAFQAGGLRLPVSGWKTLLRLAWFTGHSSQRTVRDGIQRRVFAIADRLERSEGDTLVVSHAGVMMYLSRELRRRGFVGPILRAPKHAFTYVYER